jgi:hypothetical protein
MPLKGKLHHPHDYITNIISPHMTEGVTRTSLSAGLQHETSVARDHLCQITSNWKLSHKCKERYEFSSRNKVNRTTRDLPVLLLPPSPLLLLILILLLLYSVNQKQKWQTRNMFISEVNFIKMNHYISIISHRIVRMYDIILLQTIKRKINVKRLFSYLEVNMKSNVFCIRKHFTVMLVYCFQWLTMC